MVVVDSKQSLTITGNGDVLEPNDGIAGILLLIFCIIIASGTTRWSVHRSSFCDVDSLSSIT